ncbi:unnamed protein product [Lampetra fluviatilis]
MGAGLGHVGSLAPRPPPVEFLRFPALLKHPECLPGTRVRSQYLDKLTALSVTDGKYIVKAVVTCEAMNRLDRDKRLRFRQLDNKYFTLWDLQPKVFLDANL